MPGEGNHQVAVQRSVGETSRRNLLPHHDAVQQRGRCRDRIALHHKKFSGIHDVKDEIHGVGCSAKREGEGHGAAARGGIGHRVVRCRKVHRIIRAIAVDVSRGVDERACTVRSKPAFDGGAIICGIETGGAKRVVTRYFGRAVSGGVRFFHGPRADRSCAAGGVELDELGVAVG